MNKEAKKEIAKTIMDIVGVLIETSKEDCKYAFDKMMEDKLTKVFLFLVENGMDHAFTKTEIAFKVKFGELNLEEQKAFVTKTVSNVFVASNLFHILMEKQQKMGKEKKDMESLMKSVAGMPMQ